MWIGNARGTKHSNEHETFSRSSRDFWKFSFHEIGRYDVSTMVNFILDQTKESKTFYIGHSQGACSLLVLLSSLPEFNKKIEQAHLMTPAVLMKHSQSPLLRMFAKQSEIVTVNMTYFKKKIFQKLIKLF